MAPMQGLKTGPPSPAWADRVAAGPAVDGQDSRPSNRPRSIDFPGVADHKTANPDKRRRLSPEIEAAWLFGGECPEWQRGRTVNPLAYAFVGSSPTSPTSLRSLRELRLGE